MRRMMVLSLLVLGIPALAFAPKAFAEFVFRARNPASGAIVWKAHQHFSDGTSADWVGVAGEKRPASVTKLTAAASAEAAPGSTGK